MDVDVKHSDDDGFRLLELVSRTQPRQTELLEQALGSKRRRTPNDDDPLISKGRVWVEQGFLGHWPINTSAVTT